MQIFALRQEYIFKYQGSNPFPPTLWLLSMPSCNFYNLQPTDLSSIWKIPKRANCYHPVPKRTSFDKNDCMRKVARKSVLFSKFRGSSQKWFTECIKIISQLSQSQYLQFLHCCNESNRNFQYFSKNVKCANMCGMTQN